MAHKNNITVRSSKKSVISKVEIVTVPANNVNSITSRHPVAVVVAEKLCPSSSQHSSKTEPKRLYIPGCPIPQICSRETEEYNVAESAGAFNRKDYSTRGRFKSEKNRLNSKDQKKSKAVTFQIDKVESAHRNPGVCEYSPSSSSDVIDSSVASDSQSGTSGDDSPASETHASSVPRFLLVSKGMRDRIQMESYPDTKAHDIKNTNSYCNFCSTSSCKCIRGSLETVNTSESETSRYSQGVRTRDEFSFQREPDLRSKFAYKDRSARHVETPPSDDSVGDENQKFTSTRERDINLEDDSVKPVKSGSFHIRQRPHVLETRREYNANDYKSEMSQRPVSYKKFMGKSKRDSYHPCLSRSSRPASAVPSTEVRGFPAPKRDGEKGLDLTHRMRNLPTTSSSGPHQTRISSQNTKSKLVRNSIKPSEGSRKDSGKSRSLPGTPTKNFDPKASYRPSEVPTKNEDPKPSCRPPSPEVLSSVFPLDLSEQVPVTGDLPLEDFVALAKWAERKREELSKDPTPPFVQTNSRIMALLKELTSDTFDEDKYKLSRRIEAYFNRAYQSALTDIDKTNVAPSSVDSFDDRSTLPLYNPIFPPGDPELPTTTILTSTTTRTTITGPDMANNNLGYIRPHPPPLFSHWWVSQKHTAPMKVAYPESSSSYAKGTGHRRRARCITKTKLKKPKEKMEYYCYSSPEDYDQKAETAERTSPKVPRSPKRDLEKKRVKKPHLEAIHQRGVNIPARNVVEKTAVISISPRVNPLVPKEKKYTVVELVHQSLSNTSDDDVTEGENDSESSRERDVSNQPHGEPDVVDSELEEAGPSSSRKLDIPQTVSSEVQAVHRNDEEPQRDYSQSRNGDPNTYSDYESDNDPSVSEKQELPGFMPEVKWEEVTMYNRREEIDGEDTRRNVHEAEGLLQEYDLRERILNRLEARLAQLTLTSQEELMRVVPPELFEDENQQEESSLNSEDLNRQMTNPTSETIRALLYNFVRDRLQVLPIQESSRSEDAESSVKKPQEVSSPVSYTSSYEIDEGTPAPPLTPTHSPVRTREESVSKITTPTCSPSPPLLPPGKSGIQDQRVLTPQDSMEEIEHTQTENAIATPSSSPPPIRSVFDVEPSVTPGVSPAISPAKGRQIHTSATPPRTPASSPRKLQPRSRADTPANSPADSPSRLKAQYPEASTPGQSPLPSDREMTVINTPPRSPSPCRTYDVIVSVPQSPSSPVSPMSLEMTRDESAISRPVPEEVPGIQRVEKPKVVLSPRYFDQGTQAEFRRRVDRSTMAHLDESQDLTLDGTPSIVCHTSGEPTVYSPLEPSESTFFTISEGEVVCGQGSANVSVEEGEIARTCYLNAPEDFHVVCPSHGGVRPSFSKDEGEILKSGSEIQITENSEDFSMSEDGTTSKQGIGSEMSVIQNDTYSSGDITAVSSQSMDALRQENEILLRRLGNLGSFGLLNLISQSSSSTSGSKTN